MDWTDSEIMDKLREKQLYWIIVFTILFLISSILLWIYTPGQNEADKESNEQYGFDHLDIRWVIFMIIFIWYVGWGIIGSFYYYYVEKDKLIDKNK